MIGFLCRYQRSICSQRVVDPGVGHQVGLELIQVHIEGSVKPEAGRDGGDDLGYQSVEVGVGWSLNSKIILAQIINCLKYSYFYI